MINAKEANKIANKVITEEIKKDTDYLIDYCETHIRERAELGYFVFNIKVANYREEVRRNVIQFFDELDYNAYYNCGYIVIRWGDEENDEEV